MQICVAFHQEALCYDFHKKLYSKQDEKYNFCLRVQLVFPRVLMLWIIIVQRQDDAVQYDESQHNPVEPGPVSGQPDAKTSDAIVAIEDAQTSLAKTMIFRMQLSNMKISK
mmetsp:Transcript_83909/g.160262  ORF Transcript_83909/g.160262 Transcript_83909/m.160262 type:complete len:111 (+) Transcript_83909:906-1238(+)